MTSVVNIREVVERYRFSTADERTARLIEQDIKDTFPGEYTVRITFDNNGSVNINLIFDDPEDAVVFKLKYW